ncbi:MAG: Gramicidin S synthase 2 [Firmicutes bacterium ADurb.Bin419]|nr:MAG: Gramicidin S synthase 2 [Firmicutes bacterium ADurb.Bin419]
MGRGYINNPEKTAQVFVNDPFEKKDGVRLYKTGDIGCWLPNGNIQFFGRKDYQVKIRGFRIELGDIESKLMEYPGMKDVAIIDKEEDSGEKYLCAFIVTDEEEDISKIKEHLGNCLPEYMIPAHFVQLEKIPLTPNGKVDRKALDAIKLSEIIKNERAVQYAPPENELEEKLVKIWEELLERKNIGVNDSFFDLGGHSLKAAALVFKVQSVLNIELPLREVFATPTVRGIADYLTRAYENSEAGENGSIAQSGWVPSGEGIMLLKKHLNARDNILLIHEGSSNVEGYMEFCYHIDSRYNCWGIKAHRESIAPQNIAIEDIARDYLGMICKIQPKGPYNIAAWSLGGTIAFEMVRQMEENGIEVGVFALIDAASTQKEVIGEKIDFDIEEEKEFIRTYLGGKEIETILNEMTSVDQLWNSILEYLEEIGQQRDETDIYLNKIPENFKKIMPNYNEVSIRSCFTT